MTKAEMQSQINTLTGRVRAAEARVAELEAKHDESDRYRKALGQIMALDYTRAATNGCAHTAHKIATEAVRG